MIEQVHSFKKICNRGTKRTAKTKKSLAKDFGSICYKCNIDIEYQSLTIDHIIPISLSGTNSKKNLALCCEKCNVRKQNKISPKDFLYLFNKVGFLPTDPESAFEYFLNQKIISGYAIDNSVLMGYIIDFYSSKYVASVEIKKQDLAPIVEQVLFCAKCSSLHATKAKIISKKFGGTRSIFNFFMLCDTCISTNGNTFSKLELNFIFKNVIDNKVFYPKTLNQAFNFLLNNEIVSFDKKQNGDEAKLNLIKELSSCFEHTHDIENAQD